MLFCKQHYYETIEQMRLSDSYHQIFRQVSQAVETKTAVEHDCNVLAAQLDEQIELSTMQRENVEVQEQKGSLLE